jgi:hypothetical protein
MLTPCIAHHGGLPFITATFPVPSVKIPQYESSQQ